MRSFNCQRALAAARGGGCDTLALQAPGSSVAGNNVECESGRHGKRLPWEWGREGILAPAGVAGTQNHALRYLARSSSDAGMAQIHGQIAGVWKLDRPHVHAFLVIDVAQFETTAGGRDEFTPAITDQRLLTTDLDAVALGWPAIRATNHDMNRVGVRRRRRSSGHIHDGSDCREHGRSKCEPADQKQPAPDLRAVRLSLCSSRSCTGA